MKRINQAIPNKLPTRWLARPTLGREIVFLCTIKLVLLIFLKIMFFDTPQATHMAMPPASVAEFMLSTPAPRGTQQGTPHD
jgi:hypothetical protein